MRLPTTPGLYIGTDATGNIKIGMTGNLRSRSAKYVTENPTWRLLDFFSTTTREQAEWFENDIHGQLSTFTAYEQSMEWFHLKHKKQVLQAWNKAKTMIANEVARRNAREKTGRSPPKQAFDAAAAAISAEQKRRSAEAAAREHLRNEFFQRVTTDAHVCFADVKSVWSVNTRDSIKGTSETLHRYRSLSNATRSGLGDRVKTFIDKWMALRPNNLRPTGNSSVEFDICDATNLIIYSNAFAGCSGDNSEGFKRRFDRLADENWSVFSWAASLF